MEVLLNQGKTSKEDRGKQIQKRRKEPKVHPEGAPRSSSGESAQKSSYDVNEGINIVGEKTY